VTITTSSATEFEDKSNQQMRLFKLSDVHTNDYVEARGARLRPGAQRNILVRDIPESHSYCKEPPATSSLPT